MAPSVARLPGPRGYTGRGQGAAAYVEAPPEWRGTTVQVCGLFPWTVGTGAPTVGVPVGRHLGTGASVCFDVISWFTRAKLLLNPSVFVLGLPALGKSTFMRRQILGLAGSGVVPLVLGDLKPDYVDLVTALGGQVVSLGRGQGSLNVLDVGAMDEAAGRLAAAGYERESFRLAEEAHGRRLNMVEALVVLVRRSAIRDFEQAILSAALRLLGQRHAGSPVLGELVDVLEQGPEQVRAAALDRGSEAAYRTTVDPLQRSLLSLIDGPLGYTFARPTTRRISLDSTAVCIDVSGISASDHRLQAAVLLACWSDGFGAVEAAQALADAGLAAQRRFFIVLDELWRVLRSGEGMVDNVDALTRLNRNQGVGSAMISHSMADLRALRNPEDRDKARGFVERSGAVVVGGLPARELADLSDIVAFSDVEKRLVTDWSTPASWGNQEVPPGQGNFLIKVGQRPGLPVHVQLTGAELDADVHDTNKRWNS